MLYIAVKVHEKKNFLSFKWVKIISDLFLDKNRIIASITFLFIICNSFSVAAQQNSFLISSSTYTFSLDDWRRHLCVSGKTKFFDAKLVVFKQETNPQENCWEIFPFLKTENESEAIWDEHL